MISIGLTNESFSLENKIENLHAAQSTSRVRLEDFHQNLEQTQLIYCRHTRRFGGAGFIDRRNLV
jgi:hypothetical protein